jgi:hypothetical protein
MSLQQLTLSLQGQSVISFQHRMHRPAEGSVHHSRKHTAVSTQPWEVTGFSGLSLLTCKMGINIVPPAKSSEDYRGNAYTYMKRLEPCLVPYYCVGAVCFEKITSRFSVVSNNLLKGRAGTLTSRHR